MLAKTPAVTSPPPVTKTTDAKFRKTFAAKLSKIMMEKHLSQSELARKMSAKRPGNNAIGRDLVGSWANGKSMPRDTNVRLLCETLGVEPEELLPPTLLAKQYQNRVPLKFEAEEGSELVLVEVNTYLGWDTAMEVIKLVREERKRLETQQL